MNGIDTCTLTRYLAVPDRHHYREEPRGVDEPARAGHNHYDSDEAREFKDSEQLRDLNTPENLLMSKQFAQAVNQSMDRLPEELKAAIMLREIEGTRYEDIGKIIDCPIGTVRS